MVSSVARIDQRGPVFRLHWAEDGVQIKISRIYQAHRGEVYGEIAVQYRSDMPWDGRHVWRHIVGSRYQLTSVRSRVDIAKQCEREVPDVPWRQLIEEARSTSWPATGAAPTCWTSLSGLLRRTRRQASG